MYFNLAARVAYTQFYSQSLQNYSDTFFLLALSSKTLSLIRSSLL